MHTLTVGKCRRIHYQQDEILNLDGYIHLYRDGNISYVGQIHTFQYDGDRYSSETDKYNFCRIKIDSQMERIQTFLVGWRLEIDPQVGRIHLFLVGRRLEIDPQVGRIHLFLVGRRKFLKKTRFIHSQKNGESIQQIEI